MLITEKNISFDFPDTVQALKFDDSNYYRKKFTKGEHARAVDVIAYTGEEFLLLEVKDFRGYEAANRRRFGNKTVYGDGEKVELIDEEIARKVRDTLSCMLAGEVDHTQPQYHEYLQEFIKNSGNIKVVFFIEGDFADNAKKIKALTDNINKKVSKWLNARVLVENLTTHRNGNLFTAHSS